MIFQVSMKELPHTVGITTRPQSNNEFDDFLVDIECTLFKVMELTSVHLSSF